jgi:hypothetical protein
MYTLLIAPIDRATYQRLSFTDFNKKLPNHPASFPLIFLLTTESNTKA